MIERDELDAKANQFTINTSDVQRDYMTGWLLHAVYNDSDLAERLVLSGGNCFRKAYFPNTRYSRDIDFSTPGRIPPDELSKGFRRVAQRMEDASGVRFDVDRTLVKRKRLADDRDEAYEARLYFHDFYGRESSMVIGLKLDIMELARLYLPIQQRSLIHPYSDSSEATVQVRCLKLEELLANKLKCLLQRVHTADLFDFVYSVFIARDIEVDRGEVVRTFLRKTVFGDAPGAARGLLLDLPLHLLRDAWSKYIVCPAQSLFAFDRAVELFNGGLSQLFEQFTFRGGENRFFPSHLRNRILEAGRGLRLLRLAYDGRERIVEPYSLSYKQRQDGVAREYFYVFDRVGGSSGPGIKCLVHDKIGELEVLHESFEPRFPVELTKAGDQTQAGYFGRPFSDTAQRKQRSGRRNVSTRRRQVGSSYGVVYVVQCSYCGREFKRRTNTTRLRPHKDGYGNDCYGRSGFLVRQELA